MALGAGRLKLFAGNATPLLARAIPRRRRRRWRWIPIRGSPTAFERPLSLNLRTAGQPE